MQIDYLGGIIVIENDIVIDFVCNILCHNKFDC